MAHLKAQASCSAASVCEESDVRVPSSTETLAPVTTAAVTAGVTCPPPPPEQSCGRSCVIRETAAVTAGVAEHLPLQPEQSSAGPSVVPRSRPVADTRSQWNLMQVLTELSTEEDCIVFCEEQGLIPMTKKCSYHKRPMRLSNAASHGQLGLFRCNKSNCRSKPVPRAQGTWFENIHLALPVTFQIMYLFSHGASYEDVQRETSLKTGPVLSIKTIADWYSYCRETVIIYELDHQICDTKIGGPNKVVVIDEAKFGKRKYNKGKNIEGRWVLGMVGNDSDDVRLEVYPNNQRSEEVLVSLIQKHVAEGSIIRTSFASPYDCLSKYGYIHEIVYHNGEDNRSAAPDATLTRWTENRWKKLKLQFQRHQCKRDFLDWLAEFSWRRKNRIYKKDPFEELLKVIKYVYGIH